MSAAEIWPPPAPPARVRCCETTRTPRGYEMCHRSAHGITEPHHVRDRSWYTVTDTRKTPGLVLGVPCDEACGWPDYVVPYHGYQPARSTVTGKPGRR